MFRPGGPAGDVDAQRQAGEVSLKDDFSCGNGDLATFLSDLDAVPQAKQIVCSQRPLQDKVCPAWHQLAQWSNMLRLIVDEPGLVGRIIGWSVELLERNGHAVAFAWCLWIIREGDFALNLGAALTVKIA
ncbi:hypothetical protein KSC_079490 [Ktedonobacter sp. SOSP1-52]|nr:hypothetical protein KSC_079490 [Ktedonobacter sp. SOSP1-52]